MGVIFLTNLALNVLELGMPFLTQKYSIYKEEKALRKKMEDPKHKDKAIRLEMSYTEEQSKLSGYEDPM